MSGYLDVKLCSKSNRGLTPWKAWKKQWCILRPSPLKDGNIFIVFHTSIGLSSNSQIEIPRHSIVHRTDSKTKSYSFGIFATAECRKPLLLLAGQSESEAQLWIGRIRSLLHSNYKPDKIILFNKKGFSVSMIDNTFSNLCGFKGVFGNLIVTKDDFRILDPFNNTCRVLIKWGQMADVVLQEGDKQVDRNKICIVNTNREFEFGNGQIQLFCNMGAMLAKSLKNRTCCDSPEVVMRKMNRRISRSEGTLFKIPDEDLDTCLDENQRDSGLSSCGGTSATEEERAFRISMDDDGLVLKAKKASALISAGMFLSSQPLNCNQNEDGSITAQSLGDLDDILSPLHNFATKTRSLRREYSGVSLASGVYEEISENPPDPMVGPRQAVKLDNTYEVLRGESPSGDSRRCSRRIPPPPLPPRPKHNSGRLDSTSDSGVEEDSFSTPHSSDDVKWTSLHGSLPRLTAKELELKASMNKAATKNSDKLHAAFGVFRKRIKSESQVNDRNHHQDENESSTRKRLFEFNVTPSKQNQKVKNSKITRALRKLGVGSLNSQIRNVAKSCETLEIKEGPETKVVEPKMLVPNRCSKSEENLDYRINSMNGIRNESLINKTNDLNISSTDWCSDMNGDDDVADLSVVRPKDILEIMLKGTIEELEMQLRQRSAEEEYMLMSPCRLNDNTSEQTTRTIIANQPLCPTIRPEDNYVVMKSA